MFSNREGASMLNPHKPYDLKIGLEDGQSLRKGPVYSVSQTELQLLRKFLDKHLAMGFIWPSLSPHGAPVLFTWKKDGSLHLCTDFWTLNKITKKDLYPLPRVSDLLDSPWKASVYTKIDLKHAYHLVQIREGDEWKTAFCTCYGSFEWCVMPFGLTNAPAAFQCFMNNIFSNMLDVCVLIYSDNIKQHHECVCDVLQHLRKNHLYARADKCNFHTNSMEYLGYMLSPAGLPMARTAQSQGHSVLSRICKLLSKIHF